MHRYSKYLVPCISGSKLTLIAPDGNFQFTLNSFDDLSILPDRSLKVEPLKLQAQERCS